MITTTNYGLKKAEATDTYDATYKANNDNMDVIDAQMKKSENSPKILNLGQSIIPTYGVISASATNVSIYSSGEILIAQDFELTIAIVNENGGQPYSMISVIRYWATEHASTYIILGDSNISAQLKIYLSDDYKTLKIDNLSTYRLIARRLYRIIMPEA